VEETVAELVPLAVVLGITAEILEVAPTAGVVIVVAELVPLAVVLGITAEI
jgi:hypothetical protein